MEADYSLRIRASWCDFSIAGVFVVCLVRGPMVSLWYRAIGIGIGSSIKMTGDDVASGVQSVRRPRVFRRPTARPRPPPRFAASLPIRHQLIVATRLGPANQPKTRVR